MNRTPSQRKSGFRKFLGDQTDRIFNRSPSPTTSQRPSRASSIWSPPRTLLADQPTAALPTSLASATPTTQAVVVAPSPVAIAVPSVIVDSYHEPPGPAKQYRSVESSDSDKNGFDPAISTSLVEPVPPQGTTEVLQGFESRRGPNPQHASSHTTPACRFSNDTHANLAPPDAAEVIAVGLVSQIVRPPPPTDTQCAAPVHTKPCPVPDAFGSDKVSEKSPDLVTPAVVADQWTTAKVWRGLRTSLEALHRSAILFPPVQSSISAFIPCVDLMEEMSNNDQEYNELASEITSLTELLAQHMKPSTSARMSGSIANFARGIEEQAKIIAGKRERGIGRRLAGVGSDERELVRCYHRITAFFRQLQADATLSMWDIVNDHMAHARLGELSPVKNANYDSALSSSISRRTCTKGTRVAIINELNGWSRDPKAADLYWMNGMAGTGKTTIACTFSESLEERKQLAGSFFCTRAAPECLKANRIVPTIAYQLAQYSIPFQSALCGVLSQDPNIGSKNITKQFERLLKEPLLKVKEAIPRGLVVVVDALDECDDMLDVELFLSVLLRFAADIPLKFFVTSRPEPEIYHRMVGRGQGYRTVMHLHEVEKSLVRADIELYLETELESMSPTPAQVKELANRSGILFIYAATLVRYIRSRKAQTSSQRRLQSVLSMISEPTKQYAAIDALYVTVLESALDAEDLEVHEARNVRQVLQTVICAREPVSMEVLAVLAGLEDEELALAALQPLRAVLHLSESTGLVSTLHASFPEFMFDEARSGSFSCRSAEHNEAITHRCFERMKSQLRFNICNLESSFLSDSDVTDLFDRVTRLISPALLYACRYWGHHLGKSTHTDPLLTLLGDFLSNQLLFWMEVLNVKGEIITGADILLRVKQWLQASSASEERARAVDDALSFVTSFASNPVSQSTPHIYVSSLPFCPRSSTVFKNYWKKTKGLINITGRAITRREAAALTTWKTNMEVLAVAYSPNSSRVAVGDVDGTITLRDVYTGIPITESLKGHAYDSEILSIAYSPDGTRIVSGSDDEAIRVWNAHDGTPVAGPFKGHSSPVWSVSYSPDGTRIASGSNNGTIRTWDAYDGSPIGGQFHGHTTSVWSVAYSPDGTRLVSGSKDKTIRVWNAYEGILSFDPLVGHVDEVWSVAFSPDGLHIVSGSSDCSIGVWSLWDNKCSSVGYIWGHNGRVLSVAYSPDSTRIVSGSSDKTVRVWDALGGYLVAGPFEGHARLIRSVAYLPNNACIVSGSFDKTIRVWNVRDTSFDICPPKQEIASTLSVDYSPNGACIVSGSANNVIQVWDALNGTALTASFQGHTGSIYSVAYSPDGTRIASASGDHTVRVWDAFDGTPVAEPFRGHGGPVLSVTYSPSGNQIASSSSDSTIRVWNASGGGLIAGPFRGHSTSVRSIAYSPNGTRIVSGSYDHTLRVWDALDGAPTTNPFEGHTAPVLSVAYSPGGTRIISASSDKTIRVWDAFDGTAVASPFQGHTALIYSIAYSPDGTRVVSASGDKTVRVWDAFDGTPIAEPFQGHTSPVISVAYSPDGTHIISSSEDKTIRVWKAPGIAASSPESPTGYPELATPVREDGWFVCSDAKLLLWLPFELRFANILPNPNCLLVVGEDQFDLSLSSGGVLVGERWVHCYQKE